MLKKQRCERFSGATPFLLPGSTCCARLTTRFGGVPQNSGENNAPVETSP
jgi:hypothetical protein